jgi:hypothetical protein
MRNAQCAMQFFKGPAKKKSVTPVVGGWVRVRKMTRVRFIFSIFFYRVFELPSSRNAQKRDLKKIEKKSVLDFWSIFLQKLFDTIFL